MIFIIDVYCKSLPFYLSQMDLLRSVKWVLRNVQKRQELVSLNKLQKVFDHFKYRHFHPGCTFPSGSQLIAEVEIPVQNHRLLPDSKLFYCKRAPTVTSKKTPYSEMSSDF